ncbi:MAG: hypothetical protein ABSG86_19695 [Thermoguttaceae bacterium]|jgi:hypothetical protein
MKIECPGCRQAIPAEDISLETGYAKCRQCGEVFKLADVLPGYAPPATPAEKPPERPFDAWAVLERDKERLIIHIPAQGMRAGTWGMLGFATFWLAFIAFWTAGALGVFFGGGIQWGNALFAAFSTPFWLVGFGMLAGVAWASRGSRSVYLDASVLQTQLRCLAWRRSKTIDRAAVQHAREGVVQAKSNGPASAYFPCSAEIIFEKGSFRLPCTNEPEQKWLIAEINDFLQSVPYRPSPDMEARNDLEWRRERE